MRFWGKNIKKTESPKITYLYFSKRMNSPEREAFFSLRGPVITPPQPRRRRALLRVRVGSGSQIRVRDGCGSKLKYWYVNGTEIILFSKASTGMERVRLKFNIGIRVRNLYPYLYSRVWGIFGKL